MALGDTTTLEIRTPEGVMFSLPLAGPVSRAAAMMIDALIIIAAMWVLSISMAFVAILSPQWAVGLQMILVFSIQTAYGMVCEWVWRGRTVGKHVMKLRVVDDRGLGLRPGQVVVRNLLRAVDSLPVFYLVGGVSMVLTRHCQRLGDLAAGTVVVRTVPIQEPRLDSLMAGQYNSFRQHPIVEARLRQQVTPAEAGLALSAVMRREELHPDHRLRVYRELAAHFRQLAPFPPESTAGLTDEQYIRNVVETLFRRRGT